jgi:proline dehydrogenase
LLRAFFIALSQSQFLRAMAEKSSLGRRLSRRFVAGTELEDVLEAAKEINGAGCSVSADNLGENVTRSEEVEQHAALYHRLLDEIAARQLNANVSVKLTQMGLDVDERLARGVIDGLVDHAARDNNFVRVDMEGSPYTQRTLDFVRELHGKNGNQGRVGAVIQAYMRRSEDDVEQLLRERIRIRLCKGAYKEPAELAFQKMPEVNENYIRLMKMLLSSGVYHGIATHDENMIAATLEFARAQKVAPEAFEFQMLYGIRRDLQRKLVNEGWRMRVYIPFGAEWYPYFMRRLAERPANALFVLRNLLR